MSIVKEFIIKEVLDYELNTDINILEELQSCNLSIMIDLIKLGNKCSDEEAEDILDRCINELGFEETVTQLAYELIGTRPDENKDSTNSEEFSSFSEVLEDFYNNIQSVDEKLGLSDFWNMSTRYMYKYADGIQSRFINNKNIKLQDSYELTAMILRGLGGELDECPRYDEDGTVHKESNKDRVLKKLQGRRR